MSVTEVQALAALPHRLTGQVRELKQALEGFPVLDLIETYAVALTSPLSDKHVAARRFHLADSCLSKWQNALDLALMSSPVNSDAAHLRIRRKQERARDALAHVRSVLVSVEHQRARQG